MPHRSPRFRARLGALLLPSALLAGAVALAGCSKKEAEATPVQSAAASRQRIVLDVEATGVITPINAVEVRSQVSGQIIALPVQTGTVVKEGDVLARIDPRIPSATYRQAQAAVTAARAQVSITRTQYDRNRQLLQQGVLTAPELESARLAYANAQSQLVAATSQLENARIGIENVVIRAPSAGVVIARPVAVGQVIASSTNSPSGGTILMTLADLGVVYDSTLVNESDIGRVKPGQDVRVTVDAYPGRTFRGTVQKVEPRATVQQSVTFFPVLVRLENEDGALMPGMNSDVSVLVAERDGALAVPLDAVRSMREAPAAAAALGLDGDAIREQLRAARGGAGGGRASGEAPAGGDTGASRAVGARGDSSRGRGDSGAARGAGSGASGAASGARGQGRGGRGGRGAGGGESGGGGGGGSAGVGGALVAGSRAVVFVKDGAAWAPRVVTLGISNYDVAEIASGLREGEQVALVSGAVLQQQRQQRQEQIRSRSSLPGMGGSSGGGGNRGGGGGPGGGGGGGRGG